MKVLLIANRGMWFLACHVKCEANFTVVAGVCEYWV